MSHFSKMLIGWRKAERLTQGQLARHLGVSQQAVSNWERNLDVPSAKAEAEIRAMMAKADFLSVDTTLVAAQNAIRALFDLDGIKLCVTSRGFQRLWPSTADLIERPLADLLVNEAASLNHNGELKSNVFKRNIIGVTGISQQHVNLHSDELVKHRWFVRFRPYGYRMIGDMTFEACDDDPPVGIERVLGPDLVQA